MKQAPLFKSISCPICRGGEYRVIAKFKSSEYKLLSSKLMKKTLHKMQTVVMCTACNLAFINPQPSRIALKIHYENFYKGFFKGSQDFTTSAYAQINYEQENGRLAEIERFKTRGKILDIGAGPGHFLSIARKNHWQVFGFEYSKNAAAIAKKMFNIQLKSDSLSGTIFPDNTFDVITFHSVLEHIPNPVEALDIAYKKLKPGGMLVLAIPNVRSMNYILSKIFAITFPGFIFEHLYYFSPQSIRKLLEPRFKIIEMTSYHHSRPIHVLRTAQTQVKSPSIYSIFLRDLHYSKNPIVYIWHRLYFFQMRVLRGFWEYSRFGGAFCLGDELIVFAVKKSVC